MDYLIPVGVALVSVGAVLVGAVLFGRKSTPEVPPAPAPAPAAPYIPQPAPIPAAAEPYIPPQPAAGYVPPPQQPVMQQPVMQQPVMQQPVMQQPVMPPEPPPLPPQQVLTAPAPNTYTTPMTDGFIVTSDQPQSGRVVTITSSALESLVSWAQQGVSGMKPGIIIDEVRRVPARGECLLDDQEYRLMSTLLEVIDRTGAAYTLMPKTAASALAPNAHGVVDMLVVTQGVVPVLGFVITKTGNLPSWTDALIDYGIRMHAVVEGHPLEDVQVQAIMQREGLSLPHPIEYPEA